MMVTPQVINLLGFKVNVNERNANLSINNIQQFSSFVTDKKNDGLGSQFGVVQSVLFPRSMVNDMDVNDDNSIKNSAV